MAVSEQEKNRKLSESEKRRLAAFEETGLKMEEKGWKRQDLTVGIGKANIFAILISIPIIIIGFVLFVAVNRTRIEYHFSGWDYVIFLAAYLMLIVVHELIHGLTWSMFTKERFRSIEFGFMKEYLTPYCVCKEPLSKGQYIAGALMPLIVLGIIPTAAAIFVNHLMIFWLGLIMILSAGGDILIVIQILRHRSTAAEQLFMDHPTQAGVVVFER